MICEISVYHLDLLFKHNENLTLITINVWYDKTIMYHSIISIYAIPSVGRSGRGVARFVGVTVHHRSSITGVPSYWHLFLIDRINNHPMDHWSGIIIVAASISLCVRVIRAVYPMCQASMYLHPVIVFLRNLGQWILVPLPSSPYCFIHVASGYPHITLNQSILCRFQFSILSQFTYLCRPRHFLHTVVVYWHCHHRTFV